jgi:hypothetical protein
VPDNGIAGVWFRLHEGTSEDQGEKADDDEKADKKDDTDGAADELEHVVSPMA